MGVENTMAGVDGASAMCGRLLWSRASMFCLSISNTRLSACAGGPCCGAGCGGGGGGNCCCCIAVGGIGLCARWW